MELARIVNDFAAAIRRVDGRHPEARNTRTRKDFSPGIGPHPEHETIRLVVRELESSMPSVYAGKIQLDVAYPGPRQKCDLCIGDPGGFEWAFEVQLLRLVGDNGKPNDNMLMHILSPYPTHRSALTDCEKLLGFHLARRKGIIRYGFDYRVFPWIQPSEHSRSWPVQITIWARGMRLRTITRSTRVTGTDVSLRGSCWEGPPNQKGPAQRGVSPSSRRRRMSRRGAGTGGRVAWLSTSCCSR